jgi:ClpP class serine protease
MRFAHLHEQLYHRPWFITPSAHATLRALFERHAATAALTPRGWDDADDSALDFSAFANARQPLSIDATTGIATIHILGPLGKNLSQLEQACGATGFEQIRADYAAALSAGARGLLLKFDSPGGTVIGTPETAALIASKPVPTVAYTEDILASAAYYLAAGATAIVASTSAEIGSIGVYIPWMDTSVALAAQGVKPDPIVNTGGDLKALGFGGSLTAGQRAYLQTRVDEDFAAFKAHILAHRAVPDSAMRGQTLSGPAAAAANLIDLQGDEAAARTLLLSLIK